MCCSGVRRLVDHRAGWAQIVALEPAYAGGATRVAAVESMGGTCPRCSWVRMPPSEVVCASVEF